MTAKFLNSTKLTTLPELHYLLIELLDRKEPILWESLSKLCKERSLNFAFAFENTMTFLKAISVIIIHEDKTVVRNPEEPFSQLKTEEDLSAWILQKTFYFLKLSDLLQHLVHSETVIKNPVNSEMVIYTSKFPSQFIFIKAFLLNFRIATLSKQSNDELVIDPAYADFFEVSAIKSDQKNEPIKKRPTFFISYSHKDEEYKQELKNHFSGMVRKGLIENWDGRAIKPGEDWDDEIKKKLEQAEFVLFLVSSDFMASDYIHDVEIKKTIERHNNNLVKIIPVIVRPCDFNSLPISKYQALPEHAQAVSEWLNKDAAYVNIVKNIQKIL